ncbi:MAG: hypothetical protein Q4P23_10340 [Micrococcaceae bacterium]|nr:hypothetical protein [Micrococcaceae bacterium]
MIGKTGCATAIPVPMAITPSAPVIDQNVRDFFIVSCLFIHCTAIALFPAWLVNVSQKGETDENVLIWEPGPDPSHPRGKG